MTWEQLRQIMRGLGCQKLYLKRLSPNDNSKNQPYFGSDLSLLNLLPAGNLIAEQSSSQKQSKSQTRFKATLDFWWLDETGAAYPAPRAQLIFYPQYPEMRLSGFLQGCINAPSELMDPNKRGREAGRILFMGVHGEQIYAYLADRNSPLAQTANSFSTIDHHGVLEEIALQDLAQDSRTLLLAHLARIHQKGYIEGKRLNSNGELVPYNTQPNSGGYTLEAELGIRPNGYSEPDFMGWEVKQFGISNPRQYDASILTLMTPEPDSGIYHDRGVLAFLKAHGYPDRLGRDNRQNFGGIFRKDARSALTGLTLKLIGYDDNAGKITDATGSVALVDDRGEVAAAWKYEKLIDHWKKKHANAVYVPSQKSAQKPFCYHYSNHVTLGYGTDFLRLLASINSGDTYLDPAVKAENYDATPKIKRRNQFRIKFGKIDGLYHQVEQVNTLDSTL